MQRRMWGRGRRGDGVSTRGAAYEGRFQRPISVRSPHAIEESQGAGRCDHATPDLLRGRPCMWRAVLKEANFSPACRAESATRAGATAAGDALSCSVLPASRRRPPPLQPCASRSAQGTVVVRSAAWVWPLAAWAGSRTHDVHEQLARAQQGSDPPAPENADARKEGAEQAGGIPPVRES